MSITICDRNSIAVELLRQGNYLQSQAVLRDALANLASSLDLGTPTLPSPAPQVPATPVVRIPAITMNICTGDTSEATFAMYKKAFLVGSEEEDEVVLSLVLFYNMGLVSHALGCITGKTAYLSRALRLYQKVYVLLSEHGQGSAEIALLLLATCNNMGHIHAALLDAQAMQACHRNLQSILSTYQASGLLDPLDLDFFFMALVLGNSEQGKIPMAPAA